MNEEAPPKKKKRGPYKRYLLDPTVPVPRTTQWRQNQFSAVTVPQCTRSSDEQHDSENSDESQLTDFDDHELASIPSDNYGNNDYSGSDISDILSTDSESESMCSDDECFSDSIEDDATDISCEMTLPIYEKSNVTVLGAYCILMELKRLCKLPFSTMVVLLQVLQLLCPAGNLLPTTKYQLIKFARQFSSNHKRIDFCRTCGKQLQEKQKCSSELCQRTELDSMIIVSPDRSVQQIISDNWDELKTSTATKQGIIELVFNTDGVSPFKSSPLTIWPLFFLLANLPPHIRMLKKNIVTCIFWVAKSKPPLQQYLGQFKNLIDTINTKGLAVKTPQGKKNFYLKPLFGVFDMVAKAPILNMHQFNGKNGCPSCLHPGVRIGHTQTYPPGIDYDLRTTDSMKSAGTKADQDSVVIDGIKGTTILSSIVDLVTGAPIDYMHCVLEGVVKRLLDKWVTSPGTPYYLNKQAISKIDAVFTQQCPPHDFSRAPRSIQKHRKFWKANEYRAWLLFYSLPLLITFLPPLYIHHFALLVCAIHILLQPNISPTQIKAAQMMLNDFVTFIPELYTSKECTLNSHLLLHLGQQVQTWGPLWNFSAFPFEHKNGYLMGHVHSPHRVADQILFSLDLNHTLDSLQQGLLKNESEEVLAFLSFSRTHLPGQILLQGSYIVGNVNTAILSDTTIELIKSVTGACPREVREFSRVYHRKTILHSIKYGRLDSKRNSSICAYLCNDREHYGSIECFYIINSTPLALIKPFTQSGTYLQTVGIPGREILQKYATIDLLSAFIIQVKTVQTMPLVVVKLECIVCKCIKVQPTINSSDISFVIKLPNPFECH